MLTSIESVQNCTAVRLDYLNHPKSDFHVVKLSFAAGAILPLILISLANSISYLRADGPLGWFRVLLWPTSILTTGMQYSYFTLTCVYSILLNISIYLVIGCLVWLGLQRPRSIVFLTIVGIMYLTVVGVAGFYEWLLTWLAGAAA